MMWKSIVKILIIITITLIYCENLSLSNIIIKYIKYVKKKI